MKDFDQPRGRDRDRAQQLDTLGWALFLVWVGTALLLDVGWGIGLLGVAFVTLGEQATRRHYGLRIEGFWICVGVALLLGGIWELFGIELPLMPLLLIAAGVALLTTRSRRGGLGRICPPEWRNG